MWKREFANFVERCQNSGNATTKADFLALMEELSRRPSRCPEVCDHEVLGIRDARPFGHSGQHPAWLSLVSILPASCSSHSIQLPMAGSFVKDLYDLVTPGEWREPPAATTNVASVSRACVHLASSSNALPAFPSEFQEGMKHVHRCSVTAETAAR